MQVPPTQVASSPMKILFQSQTGMFVIIAAIAQIKDKTKEEIQT